MLDRPAGPGERRAMLLALLIASAPPAAAAPPGAQPRSVAPPIEAGPAAMDPASAPWPEASQAWRACLRQGSAGYLARPGLRGDRAEAALKRIFLGCAKEQEAVERRLSFQVGAMAARRRAAVLRDLYASIWREAVAAREAR